MAEKYYAVSIEENVNNTLSWLGLATTGKIMDVVDGIIDDRFKLGSYGIRIWHLSDEIKTDTEMNVTAILDQYVVPTFEYIKEKKQK